MENRMNSIFGKYAEQIQVFIDTNLDAFKTPIWRKYFRLGLPQMNLTYATVLGNRGIEAAASITTHGEEAPLRGRPGLEELTGKVAAIKVKRKMDESQYRDYMQLSTVLSDNAKFNLIRDLIWNDTKYVVDSVNSRIDLMVGQALSLGKIVIDATTNPDGINPGNIDLGVKFKETAVTVFGTSNANRAWTDANPTTAKPLTDIRKVARDFYKAYGIVFEKIIMTPEMLWILLDNKQVQDHLKGSFGIVSGQDATFSFENLNAYLSAQGLPYIDLFDAKTVIEKDGKLVPIDTWNDKKYVTFVPAGDLGVIHNALSVEQISPVAGVNYGVADNILVSKWSQTEPFGEFTRGELAAFPGLEAANEMLIVDTATAN